jgi:hypothetical protein
MLNLPDITSKFPTVAIFVDADLTKIFHKPHTVYV